MPGIYGNSQEDQHFKSKLFKHLDNEGGGECEHCGKEYNTDDELMDNTEEIKVDGRMLTVCSEDCLYEYYPNGVT